ncbi:MAG: trypsin-like peptidase domain-containing protein [Clostridiales bacterium]|nr:trypsin-like peptidase domain-containing protein [Candidatus Apopatousia equi]
MKKNDIFGIFLAVALIVLVSGLFFNTSATTTETPKRSLQNRVAVSSIIDASNSANQAELLNKVSPAVVGISAVNGRNQSIGTGVCIDNKSYVLTNNHVIEGASVITLYLFDGSTCSANLVWRDSGYDLAVLQANKSIPYLKMVESGGYSAGEEVIAIGTPLALAFKHSATKGIISATNRTIQVDNDNGESTLDNLIQHDASINPGNSGGPLINLKGEVIGINTVKVVDAEGMGFAIPVDTARPLVQNLAANGHYNTAYMGVFGYDAHLNKIGNGKVGYYVQQIATNSPAEEVGLNKGDIILKVDGKEINDAISLRKLIYEHQAGEKILVEFERDGEILRQYITLTEHPCCYKPQIIPPYSE